jgi:hypothetical protein
MRRFSIAAKCLTALAVATASFAAGGNIAITGHDDDFHASGCGGVTPASTQLNAMITFARAGAPTPSKPVLSFDHGTKLTSCLTALGIPFTNIDPDIGVPAASNFNVATYSAIAVASDATCGGCDNTPTSIANLTAASSAIGAFLNAGGGIVAFAGADNASTYYGFLPATASGFGSPPSSGYVQTAFGASVSIPAVNGNPTHNFFNNPGSGGVSSAYGVVEVLNPAGTAETLACQACTTSSLGGPPTPTPTAQGVPAMGLPGLIGTGLLLLGLGWYWNRRVTIG